MSSKPDQQIGAWLFWTGIALAAIVGFGPLVLYQLNRTNSIMYYLGPIAMVGTMLWAILIGLGIVIALLFRLATKTTDADREAYAEFLTEQKRASRKRKNGRRR